MKTFSITDWIFNRKPYRPGIFRSVPGRFPVSDVQATPVRIVNRDQYSLSQAMFTLIVANQEYTIQGISTQSSINVKARGGSVQVSIYEGQTGSIYSLLQDGQSLEIDVLPFSSIGSPMNLYARSTTAGTVLEFLGLQII